MANALGFTLALVLFAGIRERLDRADVPKCFKGIPIALVTAGLMSIAFMGFAGLLDFEFDLKMKTLECCK